MSYSASLYYGSTEIIRHCGLVGPDTRLSARLASQEDSAPVRAIIRDEATRQVFPRHCRTLASLAATPHVSSAQRRDTASQGHSRTEIHT